MGNHPLDISNLLKARGIPLQPSKNKKSRPKPIAKPQKVSPQKGPKIDLHLWNQLNEESKRIFSSRIWKQIDFNPMLRELDDLSKLTEKWLKWAIPTYANGIKGGPVKDWLEGKNTEQDFHYILVGEHLKYLKEQRNKKKQDQPISNTAQKEQQTVNAIPNIKAEPLQEHIEEINGHIEWFGNYLKEQQALQIPS